MQVEQKYIVEILLLLFLVTIMIGALLIIFIINQRKFTFSKRLLKAQEENQKNLLQTQLEIQEQTFTYISQEIHDHIGQRLTLARLYLNSRKENNLEKAEELIDQSANLIGMAITDLKYLSRTLTSDFIKENGLIKAVEMEIERINKLHHLTIEFQVEGHTTFMHTDTELIIFRIIQEATQNIMKHSNATGASINLNYGKEMLHILITDNGVGFEPKSAINPPNIHSGLKNMEKRTTLLKGSFQIQSSLNIGTKIEIALPVKHAS